MEKDILYKLRKYQLKLNSNPANAVYQRKIEHYEHMIGGVNNRIARYTPSTPSTPTYTPQEILKISFEKGVKKYEIKITINSDIINNKYILKYESYIQHSTKGYINQEGYSPSINSPFVIEHVYNMCNKFLHEFLNLLLVFTKSTQPNFESDKLIRLIEGYDPTYKEYENPFIHNILEIKFNEYILIIKISKNNEMNNYEMKYTLKSYSKFIDNISIKYTCTELINQLLLLLKIKDSPKILIFLLSNLFPLLKFT
jgi:hypothetical protein